MDFLGYGSATSFEGAVGPTLSNAVQAVRADFGYTETDNNAADFVTADVAPFGSPVCATPTRQHTCTSADGGEPD